MHKMKKLVECFMHQSFLFKIFATAIRHSECADQISNQSVIDIQNASSFKFHSECAALVSNNAAVVTISVPAALKIQNLGGSMIKMRCEVKCIN